MLSGRDDDMKKQPMAMLSSPTRKPGAPRSRSTDGRLEAQASSRQGTRSANTGAYQGATARPRDKAPRGLQVPKPVGEDDRQQAQGSAAPLFPTTAVRLNRALAPFSLTSTKGSWLPHECLGPDTLKAAMQALEDGLLDPWLLHLLESQAISNDAQRMVDAGLGTRTEQAAMLLPGTNTMAWAASLRSSKQASSARGAEPKAAAATAAAGRVARARARPLRGCAPDAPPVEEIDAVLEQEGLLQERDFLVHSVCSLVGGCILGRSQHKITELSGFVLPGVCGTLGWGPSGLGHSIPDQHEDQSHVRASICRWSTGPGQQEGRLLVPCGPGCAC